MGQIKRMKNKKNISIFVIVCILILSISIVFVSSEFTKSSRAKRVVSPLDTQGTMFSSNYLSKLRDDGILNKRFLYVLGETNNAAAEVTICNFAQGNPTLAYDRNITYNLVARLVKLNGITKTYDNISSNIGDLYVDVKFKNGTKTTLNASNLSVAYNSNPMMGGTPTRDVLSIEFSSGFNTNTDIFLEVDATLDGSYLGLSDLEGYFIPVVKNQQAANRWEGGFTDNPVVPPSALDGFNYVISGTGKGTITLKWKTDKININDLFISKTSNGETIGLTKQTTGEYTSVTFPVDSIKIDRYDIQFYKESTSASDFDAWDKVKNYVVYEFDETP